jgi:glycosyltransferase involved in cell wall biosynthesis
VTAPIVVTAYGSDLAAPAWLLSEDVERLMPDAEFAALAVDSAPVAPTASGILIDELDADARIVHDLVACADGEDLASALVPALISTLSIRYPGRPVIYLAAEVALFQDLADLAVAPGVTAVPRRLTPVPNDYREPDSETVFRFGSVAPSLIVVPPGSEGFCQWWLERMRRAVCDAEAAPRFGVSFFDEAIASGTATAVRDPTLAVAYWNADERVSVIGDGDVPMSARAIHFAGYRAHSPFLLSADAPDDPRVRVSDVPRLRSLLVQRAERLALAEAQIAKVARPDAPADHIDERLRRLYRSALGRHLDVGDPAPPDFVASTPTTIAEFVCSADPDLTEAPLLPRLLWDIYLSRRDLQWTFPRVGTIDAGRFREWVEHHGVVEEAITGETLGALRATPWWRAPLGLVRSADTPLGDGVSMVGHLRAASGVGEAARLMLDALDASAPPFEVDAIAVGERIVEIERPITGSASQRVNLVCVTADQLGGFASIVGPEFFRGRYTIGSWTWETDRLPAAMARNAVFVDEIWVPSTYVRDAVAPVVDRPIVVIPYPVVRPPVEQGFSIASLGAPARPYFLCMFDFLSGFARKNPLAVVDAYARAFDPADGVTLILKTSNGTRRIAELEQLLAAAESRPDIICFDGVLTQRARGALIAGAVAYVSLHRAEGFGLGMAEAMALGRPVVASAYSGNLDFMDEHSAYLVPTSPVRVGERSAPYAPDDTWAEPDIEAAAAQLLRVVSEPTEAQSRASAGQQRAALLAPATVGALERERIGAALLALNGGYASSAASSVEAL